MKTITVRYLRHKWPQAEAWLRQEGEILVTRDSKPVAKLVKVAETKPARKRFDAKEHAAWQRSVFGDKVFKIVDRIVAEDRAERKLVKR